jgi:hypothetical protein
MRLYGAAVVLCNTRTTKSLCPAGTGSVAPTNIDIRMEAKYTIAAQLWSRSLVACRGLRCGGESRCSNDGVIGWLRDVHAIRIVSSPDHVTPLARLVAR